jgi:hypothetical protein
MSTLLTMFRIGAWSKLGSEAVRSRVVTDSPLEQRLPGGILWALPYGSRGSPTADEEG